MSRPLVSVVIPAFNAETYLALAIESALGQTLPPFEVIVVDDGSTDRTAAIAATYAPQVRVLQQVNAGQATARNRGAESSRGEYLAFLDADDIWRPEKNAQQIALLRDRPELGLVYCSIETIDEQGISLGIREAKLRGRAFGAILLREHTNICGSSILMTRERLMDAGGFDATLTPCEETDLLLRVAARNPIDFDEAPLVLYRLHATNAHRNLDRMAVAWRRLYAKALQMPESRARGPVFRARCRGKLHRMLAGDYALAGRRGTALCEAVLAFACWPPEFVLRPVASKTVQRSDR